MRIRQGLFRFWVPLPMATVLGVAASLLSQPGPGLAASFQGLGALPGAESNYSTPWDISADGFVVVGETGSANGREAFRWTAATGMVGLGGLGGEEFYSSAIRVSADGSVVPVPSIAYLGNQSRGVSLDGGHRDGRHGLPAGRRVLERRFRSFGRRLRGSRRQHLRSLAELW